MNAAHANGLLLPPVEIGYAPLYIVRNTPPCRDSTVISIVRALVIGMTLVPPAVGAIGIAAMLIAGGF